MSKRKPEPPPAPDPLPCPDGLSERSRELWAYYTRNQVRTPAKAALLTEALRSLDRANEAAAELSRVGLTVTTGKGGMVRVNPLTKVEKDSRQLAARLLDQLHLDVGFRAGY